MRKLIGKEVTGIVYDQSGITFQLKDQTEIKYSAEGDCCSHSFIESIDTPEVFQDCTILEACSESGEQKTVNDWEEHKWTFYKFRTTKGWATLSFRNESNGYYDGWLQEVI